MSTVGTHRKTDCLFKNTSTKYNKYIVNQNRYSVLENILLESECYLFLQNSIVPSWIRPEIMFIISN